MGITVSVKPVILGSSSHTLQRLSNSSDHRPAISMATMLLSQAFAAARPVDRLSSLASSSSAAPALLRLRRPSCKSSSAASARSRSISVSCALEALIFDCDGVILESEHLHRQAYNDAFTHFNVRCPPESQSPLDWSLEFYDVFQNQVGGGKPKMRWYFKENGWPTSSIYESPPENDDDREKLIDTLQYWKTERYKEIVKSGSVKPRPGVLRLMDEARAAGKKVSVCSAGTKSSVILCLESLLGMDRFKGLDCFLAGDDVKEKKPNPLIYQVAAEKLGVSSSECLVVEDSVIGLQAATGAGMSCIIYYTSSTAYQDFTKAIGVYPDLGNVSFKDLELLLQKPVAS